ncbi:MAG: hypothetical protein Q8Q03_02260 [bacterium]|nr:hypothetical protein [bacterium]
MRFDRADRIAVELHCDPSLEKAYHIIGYQLGDRAESLVDEAFRKMKDRSATPKWLINWVHSPKYLKEDKSGVDFVFITDRGAILINIKSSELMAKKFNQGQSKGKKIHAVAVDVMDSPEAIYTKMINQISLIRKTM